LVHGRNRTEKYLHTLDESTLRKRSEDSYRKRW